MSEMLRRHTVELHTLCGCSRLVELPREQVEYRVVMQVALQAGLRELWPVSSGSTFIRDSECVERVFRYSSTLRGKSGEPVFLEVLNR